VSRRSPRCGHPVRRYELPGRPAFGDSACGRRAGHPGPCRSAESLSRQRTQAPSGSPEVAEVIREARRAARLTQRRLAALLSVTEHCVQLWERAERTPAPESWVQLELTLGPLGIAREAPEAATREDHASAA
jgi:ribosome-binding protein aMBF1 (putative translation factor)